MKRHLIFLLLVVSFASVSAQQIGLSKNYFNIHVGAGLGSILYDPADGSMSMGPGALAIFQYQHFFNRHWGIGVGVKASAYFSKATYSFLESSEQLIHPDNGWLYESRTLYDNWCEHQQLYSIGVPVQAFYRYTVSKRWELMAGLGVLVDYQAKSNFEVVDGTYETRGFFPNIGGELRNLPEHGFTVTESGATGDLNPASINVSGIADIGFNYNLSHWCDMYLGLYAAYGITNLYQDATSPLFSAQDGAAEKTYNGTFRSSQINQAHTFAAGVKVGFSFGRKYPKPEVEIDLGLDDDENVEDIDEVSNITASPQVPYVEMARDYAKAAALYARDKNNPEADVAARDAHQAADETAENVAAGDILAAEQSLERAKEAFERARRAAALGNAFNESLEDVHDRQAYMRLQQMFLTMNTTIYFNTGKSVMISDIQTMRNLRQVAEELRQSPNLVIGIEGHTDVTGTPAHNVILSMQRAQYLANILHGMGVRPSQMRLFAKGQDEPIATNENEEGRALNRRAQLVIIK